MVNGSSPKRYVVLDGMRGLAALAVMISHYTQHSSIEIFNNAGLAVDFFFILSGFVLMVSYGQSLHVTLTPQKYLLRRVIRLYPLFLIGVLAGGVSLFWLAAQGQTDMAVSDIGFSIGVNALALPFLNHDGVRSFDETRAIIGEVFPANPPLWSLCLEMVASMAFIRLVKCSRPALMRVVVVFFVLFCLFGFAVSYAHGHYAPYLGMGWATENFLGGFPRVIYGFGLGMLIHKFVDERGGVWAAMAVKHSRSRVWGIYVLLMLILAVSVSLKGIYAFMIVVAVAPLLVGMAASVSDLSEREQKFADRLGWLSYPIYCLHFPIGRIVFLAGGLWHLPTLCLATLSVILTLMAAVIVTKSYEEPLRAYLTRRCIEKL